MTLCTISYIVLRPLPTQTGAGGITKVMQKRQYCCISSSWPCHTSSISMWCVHVSECGGGIQGYSWYSQHRRAHTAASTISFIQTSRPVSNYFIYHTFSFIFLFSLLVWWQDQRHLCSQFKQLPIVYLLNWMAGFNSGKLLLLLLLSSSLSSSCCLFHFRRMRLMKLLQ